MTVILGLSAFYHDSAAALVIDGEIVAAAQEERFTRRKHDAGWPAQAVAYCLGEGGASVGQVDYVAFYDKPLTKFERLLETYLAFAPAGLRSFSMAVPVWVKEKLFLRRTIRRGLPGPTRAPLVFLDHHESHAASAFFPSPYDEAAILTIDGVGEWTTTALGVGRGNTIALTHHLRFPHSLGLLYSAFTSYCGFKVNSGEYKLMGLAPYGRPVYVDVVYKHLMDLKPDGSFWLNMDYFNYCQGLTMTGRRFHELFGGPPRKPESDLQQRHADLAASIQAVTEDVMLRMGRDLHRRTGLKNLVLAGGVALNCVCNGRLLREGPFESIWIQPAAGDAGGALGAALFVWHQLLGRPRRPEGRDAQKGSLLGPRVAPDRDPPLPRRPGRDLPALRGGGRPSGAHGAALGGREGGRLVPGTDGVWPARLGARSILGDPRSPRMQAAMNLKIKWRESFRPFAPCVLAEHASEWFDLRPGQESPYMSLVASLLDQHRVAVPPEQRQTMETDPDLRQRVNVVRSTIPAVTHVDYSARVQTVDEARNPRFYRLLQTWHKMTGCPVLVNTSFNVRGEPIVCTAEDAYRCFLGTDMDALVLEDCVLHKEELSDQLARVSRANYRGQFKLD